MITPKIPVENIFCVCVCVFTRECIFVSWKSRTVDITFINAVDTGTENLCTIVLWETMKSYPMIQVKKFYTTLLKKKKKQVILCSWIVCIHVKIAHIHLNIGKTELRHFYITRENWPLVRGSKYLLFRLKRKAIENISRQTIIFYIDYNNMRENMLDNIMTNDNYRQNLSYFIMKVLFVF